MDFDSLNTIQKLYSHSGLLDVLLGVEEYFESMDLYVYQNWIDGEVVEGPSVSKYWITLTLKYDLDKMPDPRAINLFKSQGTIVDVRRDTQIKPIEKPRGIEDMQSVEPQMGGAYPTPRPKDLEIPVILFRFKIPRRLVAPASFDQYQDIDAFRATEDDEDMEMAQSPEPEPSEMEAGGDDMDLELDEEL